MMESSLFKYRNKRKAITDRVDYLDPELHFSFVVIDHLASVH